MPLTDKRRGLERQEFLAELLREALNWEEEHSHDSTALLQVAQALTDYMQQRVRNVPIWEGENSITEFLAERILPRIEEFAHTRPEADYLFGELTKKILDSALHPFLVTLIAEEQKYPYPAATFSTP